MNILMTTTFYPPHIGGIEYHVENLSKELIQRGHKVSILTSILPNTNLPLVEKTADGIEIIRLQTIFPSGRIYSSLSSQGVQLNLGKIIKQTIREKRIDIIHAHGHHYYLTWKVIEQANRLKIPSILTMHGLFALNPSDPIALIEEELFNRTVFKFVLNRVTTTIGLTPIITSYAKKYGSPSKKYATIPNGVKYDVFERNLNKRSYFRRKYNIPDDKTVVLFRGRFSSIKGILELAEAAKQVISENNKIYFIFVGGGPLAKELSSALKPISRDSRIMGWTPLSDIHELYLASDIFILPSKSEALPLTILEAMAARMFIISTPVGGIPEILNNYPYKEFVSKPDSSEISAKILHTVQIKGSMQSFGNHEDISLNEFDWKTISSKVEAVYINALNMFKVLR